MFTKKTDPEKTTLDEVIADALKVLNENVIGDPEYDTKLDQLTKLYAMKAQIPSRRLSADTLATVGANLAGILIIVGHERAHVVTSKALNFIMKASH